MKRPVPPDDLDYTTLFERELPRLWIAYDLHAHTPLPWLILDGNADDRIYCRAPSLDAVVRFARAAAKNGDATVDEDSIQFHLALRDPAGWSVRVPRIEEGEPKGSLLAPVAADTSPVLPVSLTPNSIGESASPASVSHLRVVT